MQYAVTLISCLLENKFQLKNIRNLKTSELVNAHIK